MIEEVQDKIATILGTYMEGELATLASPAGGVALTLTKPQRYLVNYDPASTIIPQNLFPACAMIPGRTENEDRLQQGHVVYLWHSLAVVFLFEVPTGKTDALNAVELLQRMRSRYAKAAMGCLKKYQQTAPIEQIKIDSIEYTRTLSDAENMVLMGAVWLAIKAREKVTL